MTIYLWIIASVLFCLSIFLIIIASRRKLTEYPVNQTKAAYLYGPEYLLGDGQEFRLGSQTDNFSLYRRDIKGSVFVTTGTPSGVSAKGKQNFSSMLHTIKGEKYFVHGSVAIYSDTPQTVSFETPPPRMIPLILGYFCFVLSMAFCTPLWISLF